MNTSTDYSKPVLEMMQDLCDLEFKVAGNPSHELNEELEDFIYTYDVGFPVSKLVSLGYLEFDSMPVKALDEVAATWDRAKLLDYFDIDFS